MQGSYYNSHGTIADSSCIIYVHREETRSTHLTNNGETIIPRSLKATEALISVLRIVEETSTYIVVDIQAEQTIVIFSDVLREILSSRDPIEKSVEFTYNHECN